MSIREQLTFPDSAIEAARALRPANVIAFPGVRRPSRAAPRPSGAFEVILKRGLDITIAAVLLVLLAPVLAALALLVRFDSKGPAFFRQTRLGLHGRAFRIVKFRTMHVLEDGDVVVPAQQGDARITRVGRHLRAFSLDELPQFLNVLMGDMSLVGPRPHARAHDAHFGALIDGYTTRQNVKPGITGWAQVNGLRGPAPTLDLAILLRTPFEMLRRRNAL